MTDHRSHEESSLPSGVRSFPHVVLRAFRGEGGDTRSELASLQRAHPDYRIWKEVTYAGAHYVAEHRHRGNRAHAAACLHAIVTTDLPELCALLRAQHARPTGQPNHAKHVSGNGNGGRPVSG